VRLPFALVSQRGRARRCCRRMARPTSVAAGSSAPVGRCRRMARLASDAAARSAPVGRCRRIARLTSVAAGSSASVGRCRRMARWRLTPRVGARSRPRR
jgi:hypothetical protein